METWDLGWDDVCRKVTYIDKVTGTQRFGFVDGEESYNGVDETSYFFIVTENKEVVDAGEFEFV